MAFRHLLFPQHPYQLPWCTNGGRPQSVARMICSRSNIHCLRSTCACMSISYTRSCTRSIAWIRARKVQGQLYPVSTHSAQPTTSWQVGLKRLYCIPKLSLKGLTWWTIGSRLLRYVLSQRMVYSLQQLLISHFHRNAGL